MKAFAADPVLERAIWAGDMDLLNGLAPCRCCCHEHTFGWGCPAYAWGGCRGQGVAEEPTFDDWFRHYARFHGMTYQEFGGFDDEAMALIRGAPTPLTKAAPARDERDRE